MPGPKVDKKMRALTAVEADRTAKHAREGRQAADLSP